MIVKFCYQNEIHRSSNPPQDFNALPAFLTGMFKSNLPSNLSLQYVNPEGVSVPLTEQLYEELKNAAPSQKPFKIVIVDEQPVNEIKEEPAVIQKQAEPEDYEVVLSNMASNEKPQQPLEEKKEEAPVPEQNNAQQEMINKLAEDITRVNVMPQLQGVDEAHVKAVVAETLNGMIPQIINHVKATLQRENFLDNVHQAEFRPQPYVNNGQKVEYAQYKPQKTEEKPIIKQLNEAKDKGLDFLGKAFDKIDGAFDTLGQRLVGDPYVTTVHGRFPKSVLANADQLKAIFTEDSEKDLLVYVSKMPRGTSIEQLADVYAAYKQSKEEKEKAAAAPANVQDDVAVKLD